MLRCPQNMCSHYIFLEVTCLEQTFLINQPVLVIPAYQPSESLPKLVQDILDECPEQPIIVVNDGSNKIHQAIFDRLSQLKNVVVLHHAINLGKGQALKTAFNYYLLNFDTASVGVVTADADGQHAIRDIQSLMEHLKNSPSTVYLGSRQFDKKVPLRSRFGNTLTRRVFQLMVGSVLSDTQTGLRAIPRALLPDLLCIPTSRYEYELDMLIHVADKKIEMREIPIETIYIEGNASSHFNPIVDSLKVYFVFIRYIAASLSSAIIDFLSFVVFYLCSNQIFFSLATARIFSGVFNFFLCKKMIFKSDKSITFEAFKYLLLATFSLLLSYILVYGLVHDYGVNLYFSKIIADICVFLINFTIQKVLVFPQATLKNKT